MLRYVLLVLEIVYLILAFKSGKGIYFGVAAMLFLWWAIEMKKEANRKNEQKKKETIRKVEQIPHTRYTLSEDYLRALLIDEQSNTLYLAEREDEEADFEEQDYRFEEIYEIAIVEDGKILSLISKGGVEGRSLIAGGALPSTDVNMNSSNNTEEEKKKEVVVKKLSLKMVMDDLSNPIVEYMFLDDEGGVLKDSDEYKELMKECTKWHQKISVIIKRYDKEGVSVNSWV